MSDHEATQRGEQAALVLLSDPTYVDPDYGRHSIQCWLEAHPVGECWCSGRVADVPVASPLALLLAATSDRAVA